MRPERVGRLLVSGYVSAMSQWVQEDPPAADLGAELHALLDLVLSGAQPNALEYVRYLPRCHKAGLKGSERAWLDDWRWPTMP